MRTSRAKSVVAGGAAFLLTAVAWGIVPSPAATAATATPTFADWSSASEGTLAGATFTVTTPSTWPPSLSTADLSNPSYYDPSGGAAQQSVDYNADSPVTVTFSEELSDVAIYVNYFRGSLVGGPDSYTLGSTGSCTWSIQSGLEGAVLTGNTLLVEGLGSLLGILVCSGTATELTISPDGPSAHYQTLTFATIEGAGPTTTTTSSSTTTSTSTPTSSAAPTVPSTTAKPVPAGAPVTPKFTG